MENSSRKYWFSSKYGFGWYPSSLKGLTTVILYFAFDIFAFIKIDSGSHSVSDTLIGFIPILFGATVVLLFICYLTGEPLNPRKLKI